MAIAARPSAHDAALHAYGARGRSPWLGVDWREHQRWIEVAGPTVNVVELGEGALIVFIHGLAGSWQNWLEQLPVFARSHRAIAFDLPGFGQSPMPREKIAIAGYGRRRGVAHGTRGPARGPRRQLDGRLHRSRSGDPIP